MSVELEPAELGFKRESASSLSSTQFSYKCLQGLLRKKCHKTSAYAILQVTLLLSRFAQLPLCATYMLIAQKVKTTAPKQYDTSHIKNLSAVLTMLDIAFDPTPVS